MKKFLSILLALLLCTAALAGCAAPVTEPEATQDAAPAASEEPSVKTYSASAAGFGGEVTVTITVTDGVLTDVQAQGAAETDGVGSRAIEQLPAAILSAGRPDVDGVSGATVSSTAVRSAARAAISGDRSMAVTCPACRAV